MQRRLAVFFIIGLHLLLLASAMAGATRVKDLAEVDGIRDNQLMGYGLVVGLAGSGDRFQTQFTVQTIRNLLDRMGLSIPQSFLRVTNTAAVMVTGTLPPFARPGARMDVTVAAMGDATNLHGGVLLLTALRGADGEIYALAQGPVATGGYSAGRPGLGTVSALNHPNTARVPQGAIVERPSPTTMPEKELRLLLRDADFRNAASIAKAINDTIAPGAGALASAATAGLVVVKIPDEVEDGPASFIARVQAVSVETDRVARVVVNERTGTIVAGAEVRIAPVAIMHGSLSIEIQTEFAVSQPAPLGRGTTEVVPSVNVRVREEKARHVSLEPGARVDDLVRALNTIGLGARDIISILQNLKAAGALEAELEVL